MQEGLPKYSIESNKRKNKYDRNRELVGISEDTEKASGD